MPGILACKICTSARLEFFDNAANLNGTSCMGQILKLSLSEWRVTNNLNLKKWALQARLHPTLVPTIWICWRRCDVRAPRQGRVKEEMKGGKDTRKKRKLVFLGVQKVGKHWSLVSMEKFEMFEIVLSLCFSSSKGFFFRLEQIKEMWLGFNTTKQVLETTKKICTKESLNCFRSDF